MSSSIATFQSFNCSICLDQMKKAVFIVPCGHSFCHACIQKASEVKKLCPTCMQNIQLLAPNYSLRQVIDEAQSQQVKTAEKVESVVKIDFRCKTSMGRTLDVRTTTDAKITDVKKNIFSTYGIPEDQFALFFMGKKLENEKKLNDYVSDPAQFANIVFDLSLDTSVCPVVHPKMQSEAAVSITILSITGKEIGVTIRPSETVLELKKKLSDLEKIPLDAFVLYHSGQQLHDELSLKYSGLDPEKAKINMKLKQV